MAQSWAGGKAQTEFVSFREATDFDAFVVEMEPELRRFVARRVDVEAVDDLLQEVWIAAWRALPGFSGRASLRTWVYGIALHKCHDHHRARRTEPVRIDALPLVDPHPSPESVAIQADMVGRLLAGLDEAQRDVLELYYYAQLTLAEIAAALDRNLNTVKYQFYRAHATLLELAEREGLR